MKKKLIFMLVIAFVLLFSSAVVAECWGTKNWNAHFPSCKWAQKISPKNHVKFSMPGSSNRAGYVPWPVCSPPTKSRAAINTSFLLAAWEGFDYEKGDYIEIEKGNLVRTGKDIEIYDYSTGEYKDVEVQSITRPGGSVEIEVYDYDSGEYRTFEMED